jgi:hypothetical protein
MRNAHKDLVGIFEGKKLFGTPNQGWKDNIKLCLI